MVFAFIGSSLILAGSGYKLYQTKIQYDDLCKKISNHKICNWNCLLNEDNSNELNKTQANTNIIVQVDPLNIKNSKAFVGTINLSLIKEVPRIIISEKKSEITNILTKKNINLEHYGIPTFYGLENANINNIMTTNETIFLFDNISKSITYGSLKTLTNDIENISNKKINLIATNDDFFAFEKKIISLNVPVYVYGKLTDKNIFSCEIISNHSSKIIKEIHKNEETNILQNFLLYSTTGLCSLACAFAFINKIN